MINKTGIKFISMLSVLGTLASLQPTQAKDTLFEKQWALKNTGQSILVTSGEITRNEKQGIAGADISHNPEQLKNLSKEDFIVAVIDSGIDQNHPDLQGRLWFNKKACKDLSDEDKTKAPCYGWNFLDKNNDLSDSIGHGTHVAGIIAANMNNIGISGMTPNQVKIMPLKVISNDVTNFIYNGRVVTDVFADAMAFAIHNGAKVINLSLGWPKIIETPKIRAAFDRARLQGIAVVAASGNNGKDIPTFPCTYKDVICVGSHDNRGEKSSFSNFGGKVDLLAPGEFIVSTHPTGLESRSLRIQGYEDKQGSSQAAPFVAGTLANIWLKNPTFTLDEAKAQLFASTNKLNDGSSLFGTLNHTNALNNNVDFFTAPIFKDTLNIIVNHQGNFNLAIPVKNYLKAREDLVISVDMGQNVSLERTSFTKSLAKGEPTSLQIAGKLNNLSIDSHQQIILTIDGVQYKTKVVFNRDIKTITPKQILNLEGAPPELIAFFNNKRKGSLLRNVIVNNMTGEEYFYFPQIREGNKSQVAILKRVAGEEDFELKKIKHPEAAEIISIYKRDLNFDGEEDYFIYGKKDQTLYFWSLNGNLQPLYGNKSLWSIDVEFFRGLPESPTEEKFSWIKRNNPVLGNILTPTFVRNGIMPEKDNSKHPLDKINGIATRKFYLDPVLKGSKMELELRVIDSFNFLSKITEQLDLFFDDAINLSNALPQSEVQIKKGEISYTLSVGKEFMMQNYKLVFKNTESFTLTPLFTDFLIDRNNIFPIFDLEMNDTYKDSFKYVTLYNRQETRVTTIPSSRNSGFEFAAESWQGPIFNYINGFSAKEKEIDLIESRYYIYAIKDGKENSKLPIYRESSFPSLAFAETYKPFVIKREDQHGLPALFIDSTLVFGDQNYVMVWSEKEDKLIRPVSLSFIIPRECISLGPVSYQGTKSLALQCYEGREKPMSFKLYSLELRTQSLGQ